MGIDWSGIFVPQHSLLDLFIRGSVVYLSVYLLFRFVVLRMGASVSIGNILIAVIIADAVSNGIQGEYKTVTGALVLALTVVFWDLVIEALQHRFNVVREFLGGSPVMVIHEGRYLHGNMRRHLLSEHELMSELRQSGVDDVSKVKVAYLETDGKVSVIEKEQ